jgi:hypothetical protein
MELTRLANSRIRSLLPITLGIVISALGLTILYNALRKFPADRLWDQVDFFGIWSFAKFALINRVSEIYDNSRLLDFQMDLGAAANALLPYAYPPFFLFMILPFGFLPFQLAYVVWDVLTFSVYFVASFHRQWRRSPIFLIMFAPGTLENLYPGQTGFLSAALILGGFRFAGTRPILSGTLLGLASFKPQLGILIPVALISARRWRALTAAGVTVGILVVVSSLAFGWSIWPLWLAKLLAHADWAADVPNRLKPTITANLIALGVDLTVTRIVQIAIAILVAIVIWICFRGGGTLLATAALLVGTFLANPYAFLYDMPILTNAMLMVIRHKDQTYRSLTVPEAVILLLSLVLPLIIGGTWRPSMFRSIPLCLLLGVIVRDLLQSRSDAVRPCSASAALIDARGDLGARSTRYDSFWRHAELRR